MSKYEEYDSKIFHVTQIMLGCSLTDGQKKELLKISGEIDAACREGSLSDAERRRLQADMADWSCPRTLWNRRRRPGRKPRAGSGKGLMVKEEFKRQIAQAVPRPDVKTTEAWYSYGLDMCGEFSYDFLAAMMTSFSFLKHNFSPETVQAVYGVISYAAILPSELVAATVYMQHGETAPRVATLADQGCLMCFHTPRSADENSHLALLTVWEKGKEKTFYTVDFGCFQPENTLLRARTFARERAIPVTNAVTLLWNDKTSCPAKTDDSSHRLFMANDPEMTRAMAAIFKTCPAVAAHITFQAEENRVQTEYNPLWRELAERRFAEAFRQGKPLRRKKGPKRREKPKDR